MFGEVGQINNYIKTYNNNLDWIGVIVNVEIVSR